MKEIVPYSQRIKELESLMKNPKSLLSIDGLMDSLIALVLDCEPMRKNKNIENFLNRCKLIFVNLYKIFTLSLSLSLSI
jgi:hypothetical protein